MSKYDENPIDLDAIKPPQEEKQIIPAEERLPEKNDEREEDIRNDNDSVRETYHELVVKGKDALDGIMDVASQSESARAYEVVAETIRTIADTNEKIIDLHKKAVDIEKKKTEIENEKGDNVTNNNTVFVGNMKDFQLMMKDMKRGKDVEVVTQKEG